jgi:RNA polymerase sigma factor (sigma-70 family)
MASARASGFLQGFDALLGGGATAGLSDQELLDRFVARRDEAGEAAFAALVGRHGPMVLGVCHRVLRDPSDASDAFQATFLVLVKKAGSVRAGPSLGPWLYGVSVRVARRARAVAARRRGRETTVDAMPEVAARDEATGDDLRALLDGAMRGLPARYRTALVLCYLEGMTHEEAARRLSCPVGTVRSRLARGRDLLRARLSRRGLAPSATALAAALGSRAARASVPEALSATTARSAMRLAAGRALSGTVPEGVGTLVAGVSRIMTLTKLATAASLLAATLIAAAGVAALAAQAPGAGPSAAPSRPKAAPAPAPKAAPALAQKTATPPKNGEANDLTGEAEAFVDFPPFVVNTVPPTGAQDVDPNLTEIRVTFSKMMQNGSWSWVTLSEETFPKMTGKPHYEKDKRTCVISVKLEPGKLYAISLNSPRFRNFKDLDDNPATPYMLVFRTRK